MQCFKERTQLYYYNPYNVLCLLTCYSKCNKLEFLVKLESCNNKNCACNIILNVTNIYIYTNVITKILFQIIPAIKIKSQFCFLLDRTLHNSVRTLATRMATTYAQECG